jgi:hypothetical protein
MKIQFLHHGKKVLLLSLLSAGMFTGCQKEAEMRCFEPQENEITYSFSETPIPDNLYLTGISWS